MTEPRTSREAFTADSVIRVIYHRPLCAAAGSREPSEWRIRDSELCDCGASHAVTMVKAWAAIAALRSSGGETPPASAPQETLAPAFVQAQKDWEPLVRGQALALANALNLNADGTALVQDALSRARIAGYCRAAAFAPSPVAGETPAPPPSAWQSLETAPKDGTRILLLENDGDQVIGSYVDFGGAAPAGYHDGWFDDITGYYEIKPTLWQPLPAPPSPPAPAVEEK